MLRRLISQSMVNERRLKHDWTLLIWNIFSFSSPRWMSWDSWAVSFFLFFLLFECLNFLISCREYFFLVFSIKSLLQLSYTHASITLFRSDTVTWDSTWKNNSSLIRGFWMSTGHLPISTRLLFLYKQFFVSINNSTERSEFSEKTEADSRLTTRIKFHQHSPPFIPTPTTIGSDSECAQQLCPRRSIFPVFIKTKKRGPGGSWDVSISVYEWMNTKPAERKWEIEREGEETTLQSWAR